MFDMTTYNVTCPKSGQPIYFYTAQEIRAFVKDNMEQNPKCADRIHIRVGKTTMGTMRRTKNGIVYRSSRTHKDHLLNPDGTYRS